MGISYWFRVVILTASFAFVVWTIKSLHDKGIGGIASHALGVQAEMVASAANRIDLCETRVRGLKAGDGTELYENGLSWMMKKDGQEHRLDPIAVEKWFGHNCSVRAEDLRQVASNDLEAATPVLMIRFIQGATEAIRRTSAGTFIWKKVAFHSDQLESAIQQLPKIREAGPAGRAQTPRHED